MKHYSDVNRYIADAPKEIQNQLNNLRKIILEIAPQAKESISYGMAYYSYNGKLIYFGYFKNHISVFIPGSTIKKFKDNLKKYKTATATIQFPLFEELPFPLIKKLIQARVAEVEKEK
jgi:uncharacterized protein YdhG (YjbR/CyaY superfamily)